MTKLNERMEAGTDAATGTDAHISSSSQTIAKPNVMRSPLIRDYLHLYLGCQVVLNDDMIWILSGVHKEYAVLDGGVYGVIKVTDYGTVKPVLRTTKSVTQEEWNAAPKSSLHIGVDGIFYSTELFKHLLSLNIDLFGLIENGLAIDVVSTK